MSEGKLFFVGDIVLNSRPIISVRLQEVIHSCPIVSCNFEAPINGKGKAIEKAGPHLSQSPEAPGILENLGFNLFNLCNNHIYDYGKEALDATIQAFQKSTLVGAGNMQQAYALKILETSGIRFGFLAFGEAGFGALTGSQAHAEGYAWVNHEGVNERIKQAKKEVDILIIQVHAGVEQIDFPLPEWRKRYRELIDQGADAIIAHHPHVPQGWEEYQSKPIFYSLGNFYFDFKNPHPLWNTGLAVVLAFKDKKISGWNTYLTKREGNEVTIVDDPEAREFLAGLNRVLDEPAYSVAVDRAVLKLWDTGHRFYYESAFNGLSTPFSLIRFLKHIKRLILLKKINYTLLWHNLHIESNRWLVDRAIALKMKTKGIKPPL